MDGGGKVALCSEWTGQSAYVSAWMETGGLRLVFASSIRPGTLWLSTAPLSAPPASSRGAGLPEAAGFACDLRFLPRLLGSGIPAKGQFVSENTNEIHRMPAAETLPNSPLTDARRFPSNMPRSVKSTRAAASLLRHWFVKSIWPRAL